MQTSCFYTVYTYDSDLKFKALCNHNFLLFKNFSRIFFKIINSYWTSRRHNLNHPSAELVTHYSDGSPHIKVDTFKYIGLWIDSELSFRPHIDYIRNETNSISISNSILLNVWLCGCSYVECFVLYFVSTIFVNFVFCVWGPPSKTRCCILKGLSLNFEIN